VDIYARTSVNPLKLNHTVQLCMIKVMYFVLYVDVDNHNLTSVLDIAHVVALIYVISLPINQAKTKYVHVFLLLLLL